METVNYSVEKNSEPDENEGKISRMRYTQRRKFGEYVARETIPSRETPAVSLKEILERRPNYDQQRTELPPEAVLQAVEKAVEQEDVAIEAKYERRHEIKDDPAAPAQDNSTATGSSTSVHEHFIAPVAAQKASATSPEPTWQLNQVAAPKKQPMAPYKQAILGGITAGLIALLAFAITLLLK